MTGIMAERKNRLTVQVKPENRDALKLTALLREVDMGEIIDELIEAHLGEALEQIRANRQPPPGRKPRP